MHVTWTARARNDLRRLHEFLAAKNPRAAGAAVMALAEAPGGLLAHPSVGQRIDTITTRTVRHIIVGSYELRYEVIGEQVRVLRIFHTLEDR